MTAPRVAAKRLVVTVTTLLACALLAGCVGSDDGAPPAGSTGGTGDGTGGTGSGSGAPGNGNTGGTGSNDGGMPGGGNVPQAPSCTPYIDPLTAMSADAPALPDPSSWDPTTWDPASLDPAFLASSTQTGTFTVDASTRALIFTATSGMHATAGWNVLVRDPDGNIQFAFTQGPNADPEGGPSKSDTVNAPAAGTWTIEMQVSGYVEGLQLLVEGEKC